MRVILIELKVFSYVCVMRERQIMLHEMSCLSRDFLDTYIRKFRKSKHEHDK